MEKITLFVNEELAADKDKFELQKKRVLQEFGLEDAEIANVICGKLIGHISDPPELRCRIVEFDIVAGNPKQ